MIILNEQQKAALSKEKALLLESTSAQEIEYHASNMYKILDEAEQVNPNNIKRFTKDELRVFDEYKKKLLNAVDIEEINCLTEKLLKLIDGSKM